MAEGFEAALASAQEWIDLPGVVAVGQGERDGRPTIDVWVTGVAPDLPTDHRGHPVRIRDSGGQIRAG